MSNFSFDKEKSKATILYILQNTGGRTDFHHLFKVIYYANKYHLANYGRPVIADRMVAMKDGPVPSKIRDYLNARKIQLLGDKPIDITDGMYVEQREDPDMDEFSRTDIEALNLAIRKVSPDYRERLTQSHDEAYEKAWARRGKCNASNMDIFEIAQAGGADDEMLDYIKEWMYFQTLVPHE